MKTVLSLLLAIIFVAVVWAIVKSLLFGLLGLAFHVAALALFCWLVYLVYRSMTVKARI